ncbi:coiled-coil domain-containing protein 201 isoform X1 [Callorhinus ursinus]|uniref:coiled-coil domain-containing protein 201 isoform X1 n=1 Tax=Callorhinus ursinus TaxID=34884 RepID=UPI003CD0125A
MTAGRGPPSAKDSGSPTAGTGVQPLTSKEDVYAFSRVSSSEEDEGPSSLRSQLPLRKVLKHSTPQEASPSLRRRPAGHVPFHPGEGPAPGPPLPAPLSWKPPAPRAGLSPTAALQTPRLSNIWASRAASGQPGPNPDPRAPREDPPTAASVTWRRQQRAESRGARSWPRPVGLPGIPNTARRRKRDLKKLATVMERVKLCFRTSRRPLSTSSPSRTTDPRRRGQGVRCSGAPTSA